MLSTDIRQKLGMVRDETC